MTVRTDAQHGRGLVGRALKAIRMSGTLPAGGRTHNYSATDLPFEDMDCPRCGAAFQEGDELVLVVTRVQPAQVLTVPAHRDCPAGEAG